MKKLTSKQIEKLIDILSTIHIDTQMALCDDWDRSDDGFEAQQILIEEFFDEIGVPIPEYESEEEE